MNLSNYPKYFKISAILAGLIICGATAVFFTDLIPSEYSIQPSQTGPDLSNLPLVVSPNALEESVSGKVTIYTKDQWCQTGPVLFGIGLSWDDLIESLLTHLGSGHSNIDRELSVYFIGVNSEEGSRIAQFIEKESEALGFRLVGKETFDYRIADFYKPLRSVIAAHPDALIFFNPFPTGEKLLEQISKLEMTTDMNVATFSESIDLAKIKQFGKGLAGLKIVGGKNKDEIVAAIKTTLARAITESNTPTSIMSPPELSAKLLSLNIKSQFGELRFNPDNYLLEQPIAIQQWDGEKFIIAEDLGFARHLGNCDIPAIDAAAEQRTPR